MSDPRLSRRHRCAETRQRSIGKIILGRGKRRGADDSRGGDPAATAAISRRGSLAGEL
jgi:hypothetical protein